MKSSAFDYVAPSTIEEAVRLLANAAGAAKVIAGGQSLMPMLAFRLLAPELLVDLKRLKGLAAIAIDEHGVRLGGRVRWCDIEADARLKQHHPLLAAAVDQIAHYQVRNRGTVGGSLAHADPAAEMPGIALTCDATLQIVGSNGVRSQPASGFFTGPLQTNLEPDEIITEVKLPSWPAERRWAFLEFARRKGDFAMAGVALFYDEDGAGRVTRANIGAIGVADYPIRLTAVEQLLAGSEINERTIAAAAAKARDTIDPPSDIHAPAAYRRSLLATLLARGLKQAAARGIRP